MSRLENAVSNEPPVLSGLHTKSLQHHLNRCCAALFGIDIRSLALFRIGLAATILFDLAIRLTDLRIFYTDAGALPRSAITADPQAGAQAFSLFLLSGWYWMQLPLFGVAVAAAIALLVGYQTRVATFVSWLLLLSLQVRAPLLLQGDDTVRRLLLFWGLFLPLGACWSFDRTLSKSKEPIPLTFASWATFALVFQVSIIYWFSAVTKTSPVWLSEGTGVYYALSLDHLRTPIGSLVFQHYEFMKLISHTVVPLELCVPFLLFSPIFNSQLRILAIVMMVLFHIG